jgi:hypothetical protein
VNSHKNARLTMEEPELLIQRMAVMGKSMYPCLSNLFRLRRTAKIDTSSSFKQGGYASHDLPRAFH